MAQNKLVKIFERTEGKTRVYENGYVESTVYEGANIDVPYLQEGKKQLEETGIKEFFVLNESTGPYKITAEARQLSASKEYAEHIKAVAIVINNTAIALIVEVYLRVNKPFAPTKAFSDRDQAQKWLFSKMK